ncbi:restriction endonuclease [Shewanella sp. SG44-2]|uniref:restriction endonuclease n=1 Tax=Shewanella sp. SG44-2 TaxID=2760962 RepID=UPI001603D4C9|nr:restriction endonuclease [Shewanella sp. SG44-2]MBB1426317.1 restriction endonuclease [Shewanella sp. SG44-2]
MITNREPDSWQDLQNQVARVLEECGFNVEIEKKTETVRGEVALDVYAEETIKGRKYTIAVECKNWSNNIPQHVVHGFRTVVADLGVNAGYIVAKTGFQSGAFSAAELTNIELLTWEDFQNQFFESWYENYFTHTIAEKLSGLMTYSEPFIPAWFEIMKEEDKALYLSYKKRFDVFGMVMQSMGPWSRMLRVNEIETLPLFDRLAPGQERNTIPESILTETHYREFLDKAIKHGEYALTLFRELRDKYKT